VFCGAPQEEAQAGAAAAGSLPFQIVTRSCGGRISLWRW